MPLDQAHEQNNAKVKETGGAIGLTENPVALNIWMVSGHEQARLLAEFETPNHADHQVDTKYHEEGLSRQNSFKTDVNKLCTTIASMGNPFEDTSDELMALDSHNCSSKEVVTRLRSMEATGNIRYAAFVKDVLVDRTVTIHEPIKKNSFHIFKDAVPKCKSRAKQQIEEIQSDCNLFSQLFVASQVRDGNLDDFFRHENHPWPPSLSLHGKLRLPNCKSKLLDILPTSASEDPDHFDVKVFDGPAIVHRLPRGGSSTFGEYSSKIFVPWTMRQLQDCKRIICCLGRVLLRQLFIIYLLCHIYPGVPHQCAALFSLGLLHYMHVKTNINQHTFSYNTVTTLTTWYIHHYMHNVNYLYMFLITVVTCRFMFGQHYVFD